MNLATAVALVAAALNLGASLMLAFIATAPGWRAARPYAAIAFTGGLYNVAGVVFSLGGLPDAVYLAVSRSAYLVAHVNSLLWILPTLGGSEASWRRVPKSVRRTAAASLTAAVVIAAGGWHLQPVVATVAVPWAGVQYRMPLTTPAGDIYALLILVQFGLTFAVLLRRLIRGRREELLQVAGFGVFFAAAVAEALVANRTIEFPSLGDLGMLAVVMPVTVRVARRFAADAHRLHDLRQRLEGELRERTQWQDRAQLALAESERLAALGRLAAGVGHEINNPLTYVTLALAEVDDHLRATHAPRPVVDALAHARDGTARIQKVAERLRAYSLRHDVRAPIDLRDVVVSAVKVAGPHLLPPRQVTFDLQAPPRTLGDEPRLVQSLVNVLVNAGQAVDGQPGGGQIHVFTGTDDRGRAFVTVRDDGPGVADAHRSRLGEPYFTTRAETGGLGLGLFVTRGIVDAHGGEWRVEPAVPSGTAVTLAFPAVEEPVEPVVATPPPAKPVAPVGPARIVPFPQPGAVDRPVSSGGESVQAPAAEAAAPRRRTVLLVDDEPLVVKMLATVLGRTWTVTVAQRGAEALGHLEAGRYDAIVCDLMMPGMSGMELAAEIERRDADQRRRMLFLTGGAVTAEAETFLARADVTFLTKPVSPQALLTAVDALTPQ